MSDIIKFFINIAHALNPRIADTPDQVFAWRQTVAVILLLVFTISVTDALKGLGAFEFAGIPGYVIAADMREYQQLARETREDQLVEQILNNTRRYCQSYEAGDSQGMQFAFQALQEARTKFYALTKREYPQLMCSMSAQPAKPQ
jgi:hypothetical protein